MVVPLKYCYLVSIPGNGTYSFRPSLRPEDDDDEEMADNFIEFDAVGSGSGHVKGLPEIITPQPIEDDDLVKTF